MGPGMGACGRLRPGGRGRAQAVEARRWVPGGPGPVLELPTRLLGPNLVDRRLHKLVKGLAANEIVVTVHTDDRDAADREPARLDPALALSAGPESAEVPAAELVVDSAPGLVVSADATACIDAIAAPTPTATATAPTRPRCRE